MPKLKVVCVDCDTNMYYFSSSGSSDTMIEKETWRCPVCCSEIMIIYPIEKRVV